MGLLGVVSYALCSGRQRVFWLLWCRLLCNAGRNVAAIKTDVLSEIVVCMFGIDIFCVYVIYQNCIQRVYVLIFCDACFHCSKR